MSKELSVIVAYKEKYAKFFDGTVQRAREKCCLIEGPERRQMFGDMFKIKNDPQAETIMVHLYDAMLDKYYEDVSLKHLVDLWYKAQKRIHHWTQASLLWRHHNYFNHFYTKEWEPIFFYGSYKALKSAAGTR